MSSPVQLEAGLPSDPQPTQFIAELNEYLTGLYRPDDNHFSLEDSEVSGEAGVFLIARVDGVPAGCGAMRMTETAVGEIKRMWVRPSAQGKGVGRAILNRLEHEAVARGALRLRLEMGDGQPAADGLYRSAGFRPIPCWGEYLATPASVCLGKEIT